MTETGEVKSTEYLLQMMSVAVQRENCATILGGGEHLMLFSFCICVLVYQLYYIELRFHFRLILSDRGTLNLCNL